MLCGQTIVQVNPKAQNLDFLEINILILLAIVKWSSLPLKSGHGKGSCDVVEDVFKRLLWKGQFNAHDEKLQNVEK